jgi:UDP-GlcNAc:undecaprenyl-phosphate GlcNAc-1-phosphate transferase
MYSLLFLALASFVLSLILTPIVRISAERLGLFDHPDAARKPDYRQIPRVGGIAVALSFFLAFVFWQLTPLRGSWTMEHSLPMIWKLLPAVVLVFLIGLLDDLINLNPWLKFSGQIVAATIAFFAGVHVVGFGGTAFTQWWWTLPLTIFWLVACTNAINLIDGVDGLAAGLSLVATLCMLLGAVITRNVFLAFATVPLVGCLLGFLRYNFNPASVFLGDSGSLFVGFLLGCYGVLWSQKSATILGMAAPLIALAIPLVDTSLAVVRRFLRGQPIFSADRGHIHHRLLDRGLTPRRTALLLYGAGAVAATFSLFMAKNHLEVPVILILGVATWFGIQRLGFVEFDTAGRLMANGHFRGLLSSHIAVDSLEDKLTAAETVEDCWHVLEGLYCNFGFYRIEMRFAGRTFSSSPRDLTPDSSWRVEIPLYGADYVELSRDFCEGTAESIVPALARAIHKALIKHYPVEQPSARSTSAAS